MEGYEIPVNYVPCQPIDGLARLGVMLGRTTKRGPEHNAGGGSKGSRREDYLTPPRSLNAVF